MTASGPNDPSVAANSPQSENEISVEDPVDDLTLARVADVAHNHQLLTSQLMGTKDDTEYVSWFAELHGQVSTAMHAYRTLPDSSEIVWIDPETGSVVAPGEGVPAGVPAHLAEVVLSILGFMRHMGCDVADVFSTMLQHQKFLLHEESEDASPGVTEQQSEAKD